MRQEESVRRLLQERDEKIRAQDNVLSCTLVLVLLPLSMVWQGFVIWCCYDWLLLPIVADTYGDILLPQLNLVRAMALICLLRVPFAGVSQSLSQSQGQASGEHMLRFFAGAFAGPAIGLVMAFFIGALL